MFNNACAAKALIKEKLFKRFAVLRCCGGAFE
jgi:hypothetical protein